MSSKTVMFTIAWFCVASDECRQSVHDEHAHMIVASYPDNTNPLATLYVMGTLNDARRRAIESDLTALLLKAFDAEPVGPSVRVNTSSDTSKHN